MLLTVTTTMAPATDLGFLLHKHPGRVQTFDLAVGSAHVFYPEAGAQRCTAALLLEVDPIGLVRGRNDPAGKGSAGKGPAGEGFALGQYVNDRPYAASGMLAVAMARVFRTAMAGRCEARPELAADRCRWRCTSPRCRAAAARSWPPGCSHRSAGARRRRLCPWTRSFPTGAPPATSTCG